VPLILLQHFPGNLDNWDPALVDALASGRHVVAFDNAGVGASGGATPRTVAEMARDAMALLDALGFVQVDVVGFSLGSFVAQEIALTRPACRRSDGWRPARPTATTRPHDHLGDPAGPVRRGLRLGRPEPRAAATGQCPRHAGVRGQR